LNDFLPDERKQISFEETFKTPVTVLETIMSLGVPLSEIDLILVNGKFAKLSHKLKENDRIAIYPVFETLDISSETKVRNKALRKTRFILDCHLGKLAKYLRMLGFDTLYENDFEDNEIIAIAENEQRIILTRDKLLLGSDKVTHGYYVRATDKHEQLKEIVRKFDLKKQFKSFTRCMTCNTSLLKVDKNDIIDKIDSDTAMFFDVFYYCKSCEKVFWEGSHFERMEAYIRELIL
jgi:hypothetical protein